MIPPSKPGGLPVAQAASSAVAISDENYKFLQEQTYRESGIVLDDHKRYLLEARLVPVARDAGLSSLNDLCVHLRTRANSSLTRQVTEALTTNETLFFRDMAPFEVLRDRILPEFADRLPRGQALNVWSAAASSGQEAYSIAMLMRDLGWQSRGFSILGTDLSEQILETAREAKYVQFEVNRGLPAMYLVKYFVREGTDWRVKPEIRSMVSFEQFDLRQSMGRLGRFHIIFCRNVLIYFDVETKVKILTQILKVLEPGGYLVLGGAETILHLEDRFERVTASGTALYRKR